MNSSAEGLVVSARFWLFWFASIALIGSCEKGTSQSRPESSSRGAEERSARTLAERLADAPSRVETPDEGIFSDLDDRVQIEIPGRAKSARILAVEGPDRSETYAFVGGRAVGLAPEDWEPILRAESWGDSDADGDGIPNQLDIALGAEKTALNGADYTEGYESMDYPGGDVARSRGVCTDVVVRALRNAGIDLQKRLHKDIVAHRGAYPMVETPDPNIDHRRVRTLLPYFRRHWKSLPTEPGKGSRLWLPGDVVFMNTMDDERPDHIGVVSHREGRSGHPLVVNNWTSGYQTKAMDLLGRIPVTHRFRLRSGAPSFDESQRGLRGLLRRHDLESPDDTEQVVAVTAAGWNRSAGVLRRLERDDGGWNVVGEPLRVRLGAAGLGWGRGYSDSPTPDDATPDKREGDRRSPAGVFELGTAFGPEAAEPERAQWPWRSVDARDRFVDDPDSTHYNHWVRTSETDDPDWDSAERLASYHLGLVVEHNRDPVRPGAGSAIFLHTMRGRDTPTLGCTSMAEDRLRELLRWLEPSSHPVLVQLPGWFIGEP